MRARSELFVVKLRVGLAAAFDGAGNGLQPVKSDFVDSVLPRLIGMLERLAPLNYAQPKREGSRNYAANVRFLNSFVDARGSDPAAFVYDLRNEPLPANIDLSSIAHETTCGRQHW